MRLFGRVFTAGDVQDVEGTVCRGFENRVLTGVM